MKFSKLPKFWCNTFFGKTAEKTNATDGVFSVFFATLFVGLLTFVLNLVQTGKTDAISFVIAVFGLPVFALGVVFLSIIFVRISSSFLGGKADLVQEWVAIAPISGSCIFIAGLATVVLLRLFSVLYSPSNAQILASPASFMIITGIMISIVLAQAVFFLFTAYGKWLENLHDAEKTANSAKIMALALALFSFTVLVVVFVVMGMNAENQIQALLQQTGGTLPTY